MIICQTSTIILNLTSSVFYVSSEAPNSNDGLSPLLKEFPHEYTCSPKYRTLLSVVLLYKNMQKMRLQYVKDTFFLSQSSILWKRVLLKQTKKKILNLYIWKCAGFSNWNSKLKGKQMKLIIMALNFLVYLSFGEGDLNINIHSTTYIN